MGGSYPSAEVQLVYSTAPADWANGPILERQVHENSWEKIKQN